VAKGPKGSKSPIKHGWEILELNEDIHDIHGKII
jgi:hypothetical protein